MTSSPSPSLSSSVLCDHLLPSWATNYNYTVITALPDPFLSFTIMRHKPDQCKMQCIVIVKFIENVGSVGWRLPHIGNCALLSPVLSRVRLLLVFFYNLMWNTTHSSLSLYLNTSVVPFTRNLSAHLGVVQWGAQWECADPPSQPRRRGDHQPRQHAVRGRVRDPPAGNPVPEERSHLPPADPNPRPDYNGGEYERGRSQKSQE